MSVDITNSPAITLAEQTIKIIRKYPRQSAIFMVGIGLTLSITSLIRNDAQALQIGIMLAAAGGLLYILAPQVSKLLEETQQTTKGSYSQRLDALTNRLNEASSEVDSILRQMQSEASQQEAIVSSLETKLSDLSSRKAQLEVTIQELEKIKDASPLVEELSRNVERKLDKDASGSRRRELIIFFLGFIVGLPFSIISDVVANILTTQPR